MKRSKFSLSNYKLFSCDMGELIPIGLTEVLPGDTIQHSTSALVRCSPLLAPVMHPVHVHIRHFFVPFRLIWDEWEDFITGGPDGMNTSAFPTKNLTDALNPVGGLADYLGVPPMVGPVTVSALPFRAYNLIWNEYYRDQDLQAEVVIRKLSGHDPDTGIGTSAALLHANWEKDYFTSARPWEQKGPSITVPIGTVAPVLSNNVSIQMKRNPGDANSDLRFQSGTADLGLNPAPGSSGSLIFGTNTGLKADLSGASAVTVNVLRLGVSYALS